jgi:hypothetical protein
VKKVRAWALAPLVQSEEGEDGEDDDDESNEIDEACMAGLRLECDFTVPNIWKP